MSLSVERKPVVRTGATGLEQAFDRVFAHNLFGYESVAALMSEQKKVVDGMCRVLERLGLATPDSTAPLGFTPTPPFEEIVRRRRNRSLKKSQQDRVSMEEHDAIDLILDAALAFEEQFVVCPWACELLRVLGLVVQCKDGECAPTRELRVLAAMQRTKERDQQVLKASEAGQWPPKWARASA